MYYSVNISIPLSVTAIVCSNCADKLLSIVTTVQSSFNSFVLNFPTFKKHSR